MRKATFPPKIYLHKPTGRARVRLLGRDWYLGPWGSPQAQAEYARLLAEYQAGRLAVPGTKPALLVADVVAMWWEEVAGKYSARGREANHFRASLQPLLALYATLPAAEFSSLRLEDLRGAMTRGDWPGGPALQVPPRQGWCRNTCNRRCGRIKTVWRWAERRGHVPPGSWSNLCALPAIAINDASVRHTKRRRACTREELDLVMAECNRAVRAMLLLMWHTGMRCGEVRIMKGEDLEQRPQGPWIYRPREHKNDWRGQSRLVYLGPAARAVILPFLLESPAGPLFRPQRRGDGPHFAATTFSQAVRRASLDAGVPGFTAYQLRHAAKARFTRELGLDGARAALGQKSIGTTNDYAEALDMTLAETLAEKLS